MQATGSRISMLKDAPDRLRDGARVPVDRMPVLHVIFERMAAHCSEALRQLLPSPALFSVDSIATVRIGDVLESFDGNSVIGLLYVQAWESRLLLALDHGFVFSLADTLFGGDESEAPASDRRPLSNIELRLAEKAFDLFGRALQESFAAICEANFKLDRVETRVDFVAIAPRAAFGVKAAIKVRILGRDSEIIVLIPQTALNAVRQDLGRDLTADLSIRDPRWTKQMQSEIVRTEVSVRGVIEERHFTLADIASWEVGQVLTLQATAKTRVKLECNAEPLFWCDLGQSDGYYTLRAHDCMDQNREFLNDIMPQ